MSSREPSATGSRGFAKARQLEIEVDIGQLSNTVAAKTLEAQGKNGSTYKMAETTFKRFKQEMIDRGHKQRDAQKTTEARTFAWGRRF